MSINFYRLKIIAFGLLCGISIQLVSMNPDSLSNALGHFDMAQAMSLPLEAYFSPTGQRRESTILAMREMRVSQGYGDPLYKKFYDMSIVRFYGALSLSVTMKTRQHVFAETIGANLFPSQYLPDVECRDINAHGKTMFRAQLSRIGVFFNPFAGLTEKDIYGIIEFDFVGISLETAYTAKLRHSFGEIVWNSGAFLFGQYYHPLFLKECFPRTVDYNMGAPFETQGIVPQLRLSQRIGPLEFVIGLNGESFFQSYGPELVAVRRSLVFIQNSVTPNGNFQAKWIIGNSFYGGTVNYKRLVPRIVSALDFSVNEYINSMIGELFAHTVFSWGELNLKLIYSQNGSDQLLISGFAVKSQDTQIGKRTYVNTAAFSAWLDMFWVFYNQELSIGLFTGFTQNLGASTSLYRDPTTNQPIIYALNGLAQNIQYTSRISPRIIYARDAFRFGFECAWNIIAYGCLDNYGKIFNAVPVNDFLYTISLDYVY